MQDLSIEGFRLSPQQKHLWQIQKADFGKPYCACCSILIEGDCQPEILRKALQESVKRYEILRTNFQALKEMTVPLQVINDEIAVPITNYEFEKLSPEAQNTKLQLLFHEKKQQAFAFEKGILLDISWVTLSSDKHMLIVSLPALCADRVTFKNLMLEISRAYAGYLNNQALADELPPLQYADLAEWQNELFEGEEAALGKEYWNKRKDIIAFANNQFGFENPKALNLGFKPESLSLSLAADQVAKLEAISHKYDASVSVLLQACWQILLWRLSGKSDVTLGAYCDGRNYEELESVLGLFSKFLPVYCHLKDEFRFSEVLKKTDEVRNETFKWQESFSWEQITKLSRDTPEIRFFSSCFEFDERPIQHSVAGLSFSIDQQYVCFDRFKLKLSCVRSNNDLLAEFHYDSGLFQRAVIERLAEQFQRFLKSIIENPEAFIGQLEILSDRERQQLLIEFNETQTDYPHCQSQCIHQLFETQVTSKPNQVAVVFEDQQLTYAELNTRANQLAHYLQQLGVGPEVLVGLYVERSLELIVGLLGILKAGGAYLPLDPALPKESVAFRLQDAQVSVLLSQQQLVETLPEGGTRLICLD
ncbi:MAG: AMP-binding protein, partial [Leptolyngbya sp. SIO1D8]|nr:AMP-binding protein [Leptolyngbya sp. SIO1D8]